MNRRYRMELTNKTSFKMICEFVNTYILSVIWIFYMGIIFACLNHNHKKRENKDPKGKWLSRCPEMPLIEKKISMQACPAGVTECDWFTYIWCSHVCTCKRICVACSRRSDSGERCEVKGARKNKSEGGGEVREGTPVRFVLNRLIRPLRPHQL